MAINQAQDLQNNKQSLNYEFDIDDGTSLQSLPGDSNDVKESYQKINNLKDLRMFSTFRNNNGDGESSSSRSFYMSKNDFYWSQNYNVIKNEPVSVQNIILNEYQPISQNYLATRIIDAGGKTVFTAKDLALQYLAEFLGGTGAAGNTIREGMQYAVTWQAVQYLRDRYNEQLDQISKDPNILFNSSNYQTGNPMFWVQHLFHRGKWLNTYQLPFVAGGKVKTDYLHNAQDSGGWSIGGLMQSLGQDSTMQEIIRNGLTMSIPYSPIYVNENPQNSTYGNLTIDFYLINKNDHYLSKNFEFLHAMFAGTQWMSITHGFIVAPNVYHVIVPGRFMIQWATMSMSIQTVGKLRFNEYMSTKYKSDIKSIQQSTLWPEAWHIVLSIDSLTPWNFNTYVDYHAHGFGNDRKKALKYAVAQAPNYKDAFQSLMGDVKDLNDNSVYDQKYMDTYSKKLDQLKTSQDEMSQRDIVNYKEELKGSIDLMEQRGWITPEKAKEMRIQLDTVKVDSQKLSEEIEEAQNNKKKQDEKPSSLYPTSFGGGGKMSPL